MNSYQTGFLRYAFARYAASVLVMLVLTGLAGAADGKAGEQIYRKQCLNCHGPAGEGSKDYPHVLAGDRSVAQLAKLIAKTMPEDKPGSCVGADADAVATYIYDAFYSKTARERNRPARIELARLTVRQYRNAVADVIGAFRGTAKWDYDKQGLRGEYFDAKNFPGNKRMIDRTDPVVVFDFGTSTPAPGKIDAHQFSIRWEGSVLAPETGTYEFVVRTDQATRLWVNDNNKPLVDAGVKSGNDTVYRESIFLIGGRVYPLRLEFIKAKQGVDDTQKEKSRPPVKAFIALEWKPPQQAAHTIPSRYLMPARGGESYAVSTPFPPDDRSLGWERGTTISKAWDQAETDAALETVDYVSKKLNDFAGTREKAADRPARLRAFATKFAERAFRRPLTDDQKKFYIDRQFDTTPDVDAAVKRVVLLVLKSPRFLYREVGGGPDGYDVAARLSFGLWDSLPDDQLLAAAAAGQLTTREQVTRQAERMLNDPRARAKMRDFLHAWLRMDHATDVSKDPKRFPGFTPDLVSDLRTSLDLFLDATVWAGDADFRKLLLADELYLNNRLAAFYGASRPDEKPAAPVLPRRWYLPMTPAPITAAVDEYRKTKLNPEQRAGVLTHPFTLSAFAYTGESSPIHRGVFIARSVLGLALRPPPEAVSPLAADAVPGLSTRERVSLQTKPVSCMTCHGIVNPLGFTLERFDAAGRFREKDAAKPVDASGSYQTRNGQTTAFTGARDLAKFLAGNEEVHAAFAEQLFHHLVQQPVRAYGPERAAELRTAFAANNFSIRKLAVEIMASTALTPRGPVEKTAAPVKTGKSGNP
ncbi:DUF1592 domain-containing protein [Fimbriiglobus ruber]|uniref:PA14 domain protein n=1 Tax=Fimbriiglobus ruber TaxID=1908690 RepID=A0A225DDQ9_9BACT|nr:DUF1592 domain-containing protein [Fimbriiglobus ruber]OWK39123.1 hypothetical protein FRUB_06205 [Fimbriiglobus ruber]